MALAVLVPLSGGCSIGSYQPCPVELTAPLPEDAFARCKTVLLARYGKLDVVDAERFLLQTPWVPVDDPTGERRVAVFRDPEQLEDLAVVVELRWPEIPLVGPPRWAVPRGDALAERELATQLRQALDAAR